MVNLRRHGGQGSMDDMDSDGDMMGGMGGMGAASSDLPLSAQGVDLSNSTQAFDFLQAILDDDDLKLDGQAYARYFWYGAIVVVLLAALFNLLRWLTLRMRLRHAARLDAHPAKPKSQPLIWLATITALGRELTYLQWSPTVAMMPSFKVPPMGTTMLLLSYLGYVLALEFADRQMLGAQYWQALGVRAGWLAIAQLPMMVLLINKNNIVAFITGTSYERLNVIHRWSARVMLLLALFHFAFQSTGWQKYGLMELEWTTDDCPPTGIAALAILLWMNLSTIAPLRYMSYEVFVAQHVLTWFGFAIAIMMHLPDTALSSRNYVYVAVAAYLVDRVIRTLLLVWKNKRLARATLEQLEGDVTKVRMSNKTLKSWLPGAHLLVSIPRFGVLQNHPATIVSSPRSHDGDLVFILKGHRGFTQRILKGAVDSKTALLTETKDEEAGGPQSTHIAMIDGPYGASQSDFAAFDSVCLIAGSTGVTFTMAILQHLADRAKYCGERLPVRRIRFVWCVKDTTWVSWIKDELSSAYDMLRAAEIDINVDIFVTCVDKFTNSGGPKSCPCDCDKSKGPCCCVTVDEKAVTDSTFPTAKGKEPAVSFAASDTSDEDSGIKMSILPCAVFHSGRPEIKQVLSNLLDFADGESGVAVCGPTGLGSAVRNTVVQLSDERAIHKGTGAQGCYLHVEAAS